MQITYPKKFGLIVGAMKAATSAVFTAVAKHPQVAGCSLKEPSFFESDEAYSKGLD